jgi:hypothetical protein
MHAGIGCAVLLVVFGCNALYVRADEIQMVNGDRYVGKVLMLSTNSLTLQNAVLGTIKVPRDKIASIRFGQTTNLAASINQLPQLQAPTNSPPAELSALASQLGSSPALIQRIESQFLSGAGPEAKQKFDELLGGVMNGKISMEDLRSQAKTAAEQLRAARNELGDDAGFAVDGYLAILDHFLKSADSGATTTRPLKPAPASPNTGE